MKVKDTRIFPAASTTVAIIADTAVVTLPDTAIKLNELIALLKLNGII